MVAKHQKSVITFSINGRKFYWEGEDSSEGMRKLDEFMAGVFAPFRSAMGGLAGALGGVPLSTWRTVLGFREDHFRPTAAQIKTHFRRLSKRHHPDHGGSPENFRKILAARDAALAEIRA